MMTTKEKGRRSREERRHGGCAERKGRTLAQQERRSGRKGPQVWKTSSVRYPVRALPGKRWDWLQRQDSNLRHRGYEPRGMTASLRCVKIGAPSFCGLLRPGYLRPLHISGPHNIFGPMIRKPLHRLFKGARRKIATTGYAVELCAAIEDNRRQALSANSGGSCI